MPEYLAKYTTRASLMDGGTWMADPDPHHNEYRFIAENDEDAVKKAEEYIPILRKEFWLPTTTLNSLDQTRKILPEITPPKPAPQKIHFQKDLGKLVNEMGSPYFGKRFNTISTHSASRHPERQWAENDVLAQLVTLAEKEGADAYEITSSTVEDSRQEYDGTPYTATITAIVYKNK